MRKFLVLLLLIAFVAFSSIARASNTQGSADASVTVNYVEPVSLNVAVPAGTLYIASTFPTTAVGPVFSATDGWGGNTTYFTCAKNIKDIGLSVFQLTGSAGQQVTISVDNSITATGGPCDLTLSDNRICLGTGNTLLDSSTNCCANGVGTVSDSNSVTATIPSTGQGYFAIRPTSITLQTGNKRGVWTATITVTADYQ